MWHPTVGYIYIYVYNCEQSGCEAEGRAAVTCEASDKMELTL